MNKEIIVDGVDVAGCRLYDYGICDSEQVENLNCEQNSDCYYKQLKRTESELACKEQECETLASQLDFEVQKKECLEQECEKLKENLPNAITRLMGELDQLKAENEELKKIIERLDVPKHEVIDMDIAFENEKLKAENEELKKLIAQDQCFQNKSHKCVKSFYIDEKFKQTLTEIKEIAENAYCLTNATNKDMAQFAKQVLQKISECEVENG